MPATGRGMSDHAAAWRGARELNPYAFTALRLCAYASPPTYSKEVIPEFVRGQRGQKPLDISGITAANGFDLARFCSKFYQIDG